MRKLAAVAVAVLCVVLCLAGCKPKTASLIDPGQRVTRAQLDQEKAMIAADLAAQADTLAAEKSAVTVKIRTHNRQKEIVAQRAAIAEADLDRQEEALAVWADIAGGVLEVAAPAVASAAGPFAPVVGVGVNALLLGFGLWQTRRRQRTDAEKVVAEKKVAEAKTFATTLVAMIQQLRTDPKVAEQVPAARNAALAQTPMTQDQFNAEVKETKTNAGLAPVVAG
jgi:hypothetical protein